MRIQIFMVLIVLAGCSLDVDSKFDGIGPISSGEPFSIGRTTVITNFRPDGENWAETGKQIETIDVENNVREILMSKHPSSDPFESALTFEYDENGRNSIVFFWNWTPEKWVEVGRVISTYREDGTLESELGSTMEGDNMIESSLVQYSYSETGPTYSKLKSIPGYDAQGMPDTFGSAGSESHTMWQNQSFDEIFESNGRTDSTKAYVWHQEGWVLSGKMLFEYEEGGQISRRTVYSLGSISWKPTLQSVFIYSDGTVSEVQHSRREMNSWVLTGKDRHQ